MKIRKGNEAHTSGTLRFTKSEKCSKAISLGSMVDSVSIHSSSTKPRTKNLALGPVSFLLSKPGKRRRSHNLRLAACVYDGLHSCCRASAKQRERERENFDNDRLSEFHFPLKMNRETLSLRSFTDRESGNGTRPLIWNTQCVLLLPQFPRLAYSTEKDTLHEIESGDQGYEAPFHMEGSCEDFFIFS